MATANETITNMFIKAIEDGINGGSWTRPWDLLGGSFPSNAVTGKEYRGLNALLLMMMGGGYFAGKKQWAKVGGEVRADERYTLISAPILKNQKDANGKERKVLVGFRLVQVYAADQQDGWVNPSIEKVEGREVVKLDAVERFIANCDADITYGGDRAYYMPSTDSIRLPLDEQFKTMEDRYSVLLHELGHWTGHKSRLNRLDDKSARGYAFEELVAELSSAFLSAALGVHQGYRDDHAKYLQHWLTAMKGDSKYIIDAAAKAQQAVDFLMKLQPAEEEGSKAA
tara:strand:+ start:117 stop:968 length:852 start_codon:yes stop_codon:yes gene_type:complete